MPKVFSSKTQKIGEIGEHLAVRFLENKGFSTVERNYTKKWGEIDIIARKGKRLHFIEVKSGSFIGQASYRPEENISKSKIERLRRTISSYIAENGGAEWQFDVLVVKIDFDTKEAKVDMMDNIIL